MLCKFKRVRLIGVGFFDFNGAKYYYLDLHDPTGRESPSIRFSVSAEISPDELVSLTARCESDEVIRLDLECEISAETKVIKGTDRSQVLSKVRIQHFQPAEQFQTFAPFPTESVA